MRQIIVLHNQSLQDIAIGYCGTGEAIKDIAMLNNISITAELIPGQLIVIPSKDYGYQEIANYFNLNKAEPATALTQTQIEVLQPQGIGFMVIENDFTVR
ncbi:hypothetical protein [Flavobacterium oreochromis]|uniref:LysM domain-containing protein n=1 Tax=Flavobacterium columnare TaxID=996 RepID=A0A246GA93_9FLAO|nr:hypothetical protein [Flavobacterium oreochromis]OWP76834.1 hypothetical protein BWK62_08580 [Flavobacterium oreochromis]